MDLESPLRIRVTVADGPLAGERFICAQPRIQLGRANKNDIILKDDSTISASHAVLFWKEEGWYISDNGSTNGTYLLIEGKKIRVRKPVRIAQRQLFFLGSTSVRFDAPNEDSEFETTEEFQQEADSHVPLGPRMPAQQMHISERDEQLRIRMSSIKPISAEYTLPFQERDIRMLSSALREGVLLFNHTSGSEQSGQEGILESSLVKLGEWLQNQCFPRPVQNELAKSANSDLLLTLDPSLVHIPWELAVVNGRPMCLQFNMGRQIVLPYRSKLGGMVPEKNDKRLLIVANPDETLPEAQNHGEELYYKIIMNYPQVHVELLAGTRT
ncbi:MAG TPA: FHA domain-containing protein, partial [Candidatus Hydrogenedentes bacterium]|nr:FHA domain-containing protein [Candidatus Hydrogenedentota bacterium]